jgi:hypothetical protein
MVWVHRPGLRLGQVVGTGAAVGVAAGRLGRFRRLGLGLVPDFWPQAARAAKVPNATNANCPHRPPRSRVSPQADNTPGAARRPAHMRVMTDAFSHNPAKSRYELDVDGS